MAVTITITDQGRAALVNAANTGTAPVTIAQAGLSASAVVPSPAAVALPGEFKRITTLSGDVVADDTIHLIVRDEGTDVFTVRSIALYLADGTLFAIYGQADPILEKSAQAMMLLAVDVKFADINAAAIAFGDANFLNPPATTENKGVVELATEDETFTGNDTQRAVTPKSLKSVVAKWIDNRFGEGAPTTFVKSLLTAASAVAMRTALEIKGAALKDEGAGKGLDADLLDGQHGAFYADVPARLGYMPWGPSNDGAGSGLDAGLFAGQLPAFYTDITARLGFTPARKAGDTFTGTVSISNAAGRLELLSTANGRKSWFVMQEDGNFVHYLTVGGTDKALWGCNSLNGPVGFNVPVTVNGGTVMHTNNDGAGSGYDSDLLDGQHGSWYADVPSRLGYTPVNRGGDKLTGGLEMPYLSVTANGSGDNIRVGDDAFIGDSNLPNGITIRGIQDFNAGYIRFGNSPHALGCNPNDGTLRYGSNWHVLASIAESMSQNGYMRLSNNLMMVWGRWASSSQPGSPVNVSFPASFSSEPYALMLLPVVTSSNTISVWSSDGITGSSFPGRCSQASIGCRFFAIGPT